MGKLSRIRMYISTKFIKQYVSTHVTHRYQSRRMSPYPNPAQMHAAQKRGMYPMGHAQQNQNVPGGQMYPHNQSNFVPIPMHQGYGGRPGMNSYGRGAAVGAGGMGAAAGGNSAGGAAGPGMMPQHPQRQMGPQYNANPAGHQGQFYPGPGHNTGMNTPGYQNVQG